MKKYSRMLLLISSMIPGFANAEIALKSTADSKPLKIAKNLINTPAVKEFQASGKNIYLGNADAIKAGKKTYQLYSCNACHGGKGEGAVGPNLIDDNWNHAKNATDQGIFETIWGGTAGGMGAKGIGLMSPSDPTLGITPDELLKVVAFIRSNSVSKVAGK